MLRFGCTVEIDTDGDFVICPPDDVTIFSVPGEGVLLAADNLAAAILEADEYLSLFDDDPRATVRA